MPYLDFKSIQQIVGAAYTYQPSLAMRKHLTKEIDRHHSSQYDNFTFFHKGDSSTVVEPEESLRLRSHPMTGEPVPHWPEAELTMWLGPKHEIIGYGLANDFTAYTIEVSGRDSEFDGTYHGKYWKGSCALTHHFLSPDNFDGLPDIEIGLRVKRGDKILYDQAYSTSRRRREFRAIPELATKYRRQFGNSPPPSKDILLDEEGYLIAGTILMLGTGLIVNKRAYSEAGDEVTIYCPQLGELANQVGIS